MDRLDIKLPANAPTSVLGPQHAEYIVSWNRAKNSLEYVFSEYLRMSGLYWCTTALHLLGQPEALDRRAILAFVEQCFDETSGGFSCAPDNDPHLLYTLSAIQILCTYDAMEDRYAAGATRFVVALQKADGSFAGDRWDEIDTRFSLCALATLKLLGTMDQLNLEAAVDYVLRCMNFDGGFGVSPASESHAGQIFCCVGALAIADELARVDDQLLGWWLAERQLPSGGFNGRPEKLPDVCYSWWVLSAMSCLNKLDWIDQDQLRAFILACQDDETGGIADRPGDMVDPFHTHFGLAGLSLLGEPSLAPVNPIFCMPQAVIDRVLGDKQPRLLRSGK